MGEIMGYFYAVRNVRIESVNGMMQKRGKVYRHT